MQRICTSESAVWLQRYTVVNVYLLWDLVAVYMHIFGICTAYSMHAVAKELVATDARSVWLKVWPRRPFSGGFIGDPVQLSPTPIGDPVQLFRDPAQLHPPTNPITSLQKIQLRQSLTQQTKWFQMAAHQSAHLTQKPFRHRKVPSTRTPIKRIII